MSEPQASYSLNGSRSKPELGDTLTLHARPVTAFGVIFGDQLYWHAALVALIGQVVLVVPADAGLLIVGADRRPVCTAPVLVDPRQVFQAIEAASERGERLGPPPDPGFFNPFAGL